MASVSRRRSPSEIELVLGWTFQDESLLVKALTHATYANENPGTGQDYERLEFLGDAVLDLVAARLLFDAFPHASEGELSRRRARVVRRETFALLGERLGLAVHVRLGAGQQRSGGGASRRILADTFEALAGAVYLDGGLDAVERCFGALIATAIAETHAPVDFKTRLQEACHRLGLSPPQYVVISVEGPDHSRIFTCEVTVAGSARGKGAGSSKKAAEQVCARQALTSLGVPLD